MQQRVRRLSLDERPEIDRERAAELRQSRLLRVVDEDLRAELSPLEDHRAIDAERLDSHRDDLVGQEPERDALGVPHRARDVELEVDLPSDLVHPRNEGSERAQHEVGRYDPSLEARVGERAKRVPPRQRSAHIHLEVPLLVAVQHDDRAEIRTWAGLREVDVPGGRIEFDVADDEALDASRRVENGSLRSAREGDLHRRDALDALLERHHLVDGRQIHPRDRDARIGASREAIRADRAQVDRFARHDRQIPRGDRLSGSQADLVQLELDALRPEALHVGGPVEGVLVRRHRHSDVDVRARVALRVDRPRDAIASEAVPRRAAVDDQVGVVDDQAAGVHRARHHVHVDVRGQERAAHVSAHVDGSDRDARDRDAATANVALGVDTLGVHVEREIELRTNTRAQPWDDAPDVVVACELREVGVDVEAEVARVGESTRDIEMPSFTQVGQVEALHHHRLVPDDHRGLQRGHDPLVVAQPLAAQVHVHSVVAQKHIGFERGAHLAGDAHQDLG